MKHVRRPSNTLMDDPYTEEWIGRVTELGLTLEPLVVGTESIAKHMVDLECLSRARCPT